MSKTKWNPAPGRADQAWTHPFFDHDDYTYDELVTWMDQCWTILRDRFVLNETKGTALKVARNYRGRFMSHEEGRKLVAPISFDELCALDSDLTVTWMTRDDYETGKQMPAPLRDRPLGFRGWPSEISHEVYYTNNKPEFCDTIIVIPTSPVDLVFVQRRQIIGSPDESDHIVIAKHRILPHYDNAELHSDMGYAKIIMSRTTRDNQVWQNGLRLTGDDADAFIFKLWAIHGKLLG